MDLEHVYRAAIYRVDAPSGPFELRVGQPSEAMGNLAGHASWVFITAYHPGSSVRSEAANREAQLRLAAALEARGARMFPGEGRSLDGSWREPSFLAVGLSEAAGIELARQFDQKAILCGGGKGPVRLVFT